MKNYFLIALCIALSQVSYAQGGQLDPSFGENGVAIFDNGLTRSSGWCVAVQPDGKIVSAGVLEGQDYNTILTRLLPDGTNDPSFGNG